MTVSYNLDVSSASIFSFLRLQLRWKGSIWKYLLKELFFFILAFGVVSGVYRSNLIIGENTRKIWDNFAALFDQTMEFIPLTFMLGFFVTIIVRRWNDIFANLGWVDNTAITIANYIRGTDDRTRMIRRNVIRYMVLTQVLVFRDISLQVRRRFPTLESIVLAGFMLEHEKEMLCNVACKYSKYFVPIQWSTGLLVEARTEGKIAADLLMNEIGKNIIEFRKGLALLSNYDWVPIPLAYPQVVFLAVRSYFFMALIARQSVLLDGKDPEQPSILYPIVPFVMSVLQFIFVVGWMKVAESMINPLGEDDDDFECNFLLDRNLAIGLIIVDDCYNQIPTVEKDVFWCSDVEPLYSVDTAMIPKNPQIGSAANYEVKNDEEEVMMMPHMDDVDMFDFESTNHLIPRKTFSVISIQRPFGSRASLASRKRSMMFDQLRGRMAKKQNRNNMFQNSASQATLHYNFESQAPSEINLSTLEMTAPKRKTSTGKLGSTNVAEEQHKLSAEVLPIVLEEDEERSKMLEKDKTKSSVLFMTGFSSLICFPVATVEAMRKPEKAAPVLDTPNLAVVQTRRSSKGGGGRRRSVLHARLHAVVVQIQSDPADPPALDLDQCPLPENQAAAVFDVPPKPVVVTEAEAEIVPRPVDHLLAVQQGEASQDFRTVGPLQK
ncbi:hypothetical protein L5515_012119 [Caenorhabditis briggsae]|uniref:Bestrophin homolog n=1 Tax=Caenorhabditis briggsae TaxID=6238 RepID=A0AAE9EYG7_CAEBR|nr:hypothetical protein L5515_012119 [Caenorhabditis briggsae]